MPFMLPTIISNFFSGPATRKYPAVDRVPPEHARGHIVFDDSKCVYCGNCARRCPAVAIEVKVKEKLLYFHPGRCIVCEVCVEACPKNAISLESRWRKPFTAKEVEEHKGKVAEKPARSDAPALEKAAEPEKKEAETLPDEAGGEKPKSE